MKKFVKFLALALATVSAITVVGCDNNGGNKNSNSDKVVTPDGNYVNYTNTIDKVEGTIHERSIGQTEKKLISNGASEYAIMMPENTTTAYLDKAVAELNYFFTEATGFKLNLVTDTDVVYSSELKYISLGNTSLLQQSGVETDYATLGRQGYQIDTKDNSIFISGPERGVLWGVYDLLGVLFNYEMFRSVYYTLDRNVTDLNLPDLEIKEVPDFEYRLTSYGSIYQNETAATRMRMIRDSNVYVINTHSHSSFRMIPPEEYKTKHPEWYSSDGLQLCYTAGGNEASYQEQINVAASMIIGKLKQDLVHECISMAQQDYNVWCGCDACRALKLRYGSNAASAIFWTNDIADIVQAWIDENQPGRQITFNMIVYHQTEAAPVVINSKGEYVPVDDSVILHDNVAANIAPITGDFVSSINDSSNAAMKKTFESWQCLADSFGAWLYDISYGDKNAYLPYDTWGNSPDILRFLKNMGTYLVFPEAAIGQKQQTNFDALKQYLWTKLMWDVNLDQTELINHYMENVYREAAPVMTQALYNMRAELYNQRLMGRDGSCWTGYLTPKYWPKRYLANQVDLLTSAYDYIEKYAESDPDYYQMVVDEITRETIGHRYMLIKLYGGEYKPGEQEVMKQTLLDDIFKTETHHSTATRDSMATALEN